MSQVQPFLLYLRKLEGFLQGGWQRMPRRGNVLRPRARAGSEQPGGALALAQKIILFSLPCKPIYHGKIYCFSTQIQATGF
jgi:hypothetical protein